MDRIWRSSVVEEMLVRAADVDAARPEGLALAVWLAAGRHAAGL